MTLICRDWEDAFKSTMNALTTLMQGFITNYLDLRVQIESEG